MESISFVSDGWVVVVVMVMRGPRMYPGFDIHQLEWIALNPTQKQATSAFFFLLSFFFWVLATKQHNPTHRQPSSARNNHGWRQQA
jgi:hypothetical protein